MVPEIVGMAEAARTSGHVPSASPRDWASRLSLIHILTVNVVDVMDQEEFNQKRGNNDDDNAQDGSNN